jgi:hypothetical protein
LNQGVFDTRPYLYFCPTGLTLPLGLFLFGRCDVVTTPEECHQRAKEAKALAVETQDLWERELLFKIADQWQLLSARRAARKQAAPKLVVVGKPSRD